MKVLASLLLFFCLISCGDSDPVDPTGGNTTQPVLTIDALSITEGEQDKSVFVNLRLNKVSDSDVKVLLQTSDQTAKAEEDYVGVTGLEVVIAPGDVQANVKLTIKGDEEGEQDETFLISIIQLEGATSSENQVTITIENDDQINVVDIPTTGYTTPMEYDGMDAIWNDEFDAATVNKDNWTFEIGNGSSGWGNNELEFYREENTQLLEGNMIITARNESYNGFNYTSSRIITKDKFEFTHGRVDIRAVMPEGQGVWPALWMLGENISSVGWPRCGEIDIMELLGQHPSTTHGTVHYSNQNGDRVMSGTSTTLSSGKKFSEEFHVFSVIWEEDSIKWLLDDTQFYAVSRSSLGTSNPYPFNKPFFFIFNVAVGGNWPGSPDSTTTFPQSMIIDYIRVFQ